MRVRAIKMLHVLFLGDVVEFDREYYLDANSDSSNDLGVLPVLLGGDDV